MLDITHFS